MTDTPITKQQLDALEQAADRVFGKLGIDIEFTRHFLDRVNDERNQKQITIRELGQLFAKEYKRWGRAISQMPINAQAVMKDLSSAINIPFVLNKDGKETDLVAKTVMRKSNFTTPDKTLPVESVNEKKLTPAEKKKREEIAKAIERDDPSMPMDKKMAIATSTAKKTVESVSAAGQSDPVRIEADQAELYSWRLKNVPGLELERNSMSLGGEYVGQSIVTNDPDRGSFVYTLEPELYRRVKDGSRAAKLTTQQFKNMRADVEAGEMHPNALKRIPVDSPGPVEEEMHGAKRGTQVKGRDATPSKRKPTTAGSSPHPMRGKLVGEDASPKSAAEFIKGLRNDGWKVYVSKVDHGVEDAFKVELEHSGKDIEIVGKGNKWELFQNGPTMSGRGEVFDSLETAFNSATSMSEAMPTGKMDQGTLDVPTATPSSIAKKHGVDTDFILSELKKGLEVEMEHTSDPFTAMEIALDHLAEMPNYYRKLSKMEENILQRGVWECQQLSELSERVSDPREAILRKALEYMDKMMDSNGDKQDVSGYAFDIARSFNLGGIATAKELAALYSEWKR